MEKDKTAEYTSFLLRIGLAFAFFYAAISSLINPQNWVGFFPSFIINILGTYTLSVFSFYEIVLGLWLLSGRKAFYSAILSAITLFFITVFNWYAMEIVFRDVSIFLMAVALAVMSRNKN